MSRSVDGDSQSASVKKPRVSDKPWHMTWNASAKHLLIWKSGRRLDIGGGLSAGPVSAIECLDKHAVKVNKSTNGFVCVRYVDESQFATAGPDWLEFVMSSRIIPRKSIILDIFGENGKACII